MIETKAEFVFQEGQNGRKKREKDERIAQETRKRINQGTKGAVLLEKDAKSQKGKKRMREKEGSGDAQAVLLLSNNFLYTIYSRRLFDKLAFSSEKMF